MSPEVKKIDEVTLSRGWIEWLIDTRKGYLDTLYELPEAERLKDRGASYPSIQDIFLHIIDNSVWWFESVPQNKMETHREIKGPLSEEEVRRQVNRIEDISRRLADSLSPERLNESFVVRGTVAGGEPYEMSVNLRTIIWHLMEEELQHRGEMNALFWQMDVEAPTRAWFSSDLAE